MVLYNPQQNLVALEGPRQGVGQLAFIWRLGGRIHFQVHSGCWQNWFPCQKKERQETFTASGSPRSLHLQSSKSALCPSLASNLSVIFSCHKPGELTLSYRQCGSRILLISLRAFQRAQWTANCRYLISMPEDFSETLKGGSACAQKSKSTVDLTFISLCLSSSQPMTNSSV